MHTRVYASSLLPPPPPPLSSAVIESTTRSAFGRLGYWIFDHPFWCFIVPVVLSIIMLGAGLQVSETENDADDLFTAADSQSKTDESYITGTLRAPRSAVVGAGGPGAGNGVQESRI